MGLPSLLRTPRSNIARTERWATRRSPANTASVNQIQSFADQQLDLRLDDNQSADPFVCEEDGDAQHWTCTTEVQTDSPDDANADEPVPLTVNVTCDENGSCTYEPET